MTLLSVLLQNPSAGAGGTTGFMLMMGAIFVVMYFFMFRPQQKKMKDARKFRDSLQKGAKVVTIGGIHGKIVEVTDKTVMVEIDDGVKVKVNRTAIAMDESVQLTEEAVKAK